MMLYLPPFLQTMAEMVADTSSLHHQINQAFPIFLVFIEKAWVQGYENPTFSALYTNTLTYMYAHTVVYE